MRVRDHRSRHVRPYAEASTKVREPVVYEDAQQFKASIQKDFAVKRQILERSGLKP